MVLQGFWVRASLGLGSFSSEADPISKLDDTTLGRSKHHGGPLSNHTEGAIKTKKVLSKKRQDRDQKIRERDQLEIN